ncbi:MAG: response regulator [Elusimicrobia bacterium]|nr:response regulator [Elusimicrobiota bacterium]
MNIVIVDDDRNLIEMVKEHLQFKGHNVITAYDGNEFLQKIKETKAELVIIDINLPGLNGKEAFWQLRNIPNYRNIPSIIWSGIAVEEGEAMAVQNQKVKFLKKPFSLLKLETAIEEVSSPPLIEDYDQPGEIKE